MTEPRNRIARRQFLGEAALGAGACLALPSLVLGGEDRQVVRFGLIADVHQDIMHDATRRLREFVDAMNGANVDFVCQLGDFCIPKKANRPFLDTYNRFRGSRYHVLGNHDMDGGFQSDQTVAFYGMPGKYYSFDCKGVHFVALDGNERGGKEKGYPRFVSNEQLKWLADDLEATSLPTVVFSHQSLDGPKDGIENGSAVREVLERANREAKRGKVEACFCGHHHTDQIRRIEGICYLRINSASYCWLGGQFKRKSYSDEIHKQFKHIEATAPYAEPLWAQVEIDTARGLLTVIGRETKWVGPSPKQRGAFDGSRDPEVYVPRISNRKLSFSGVRS